jgi:hypothetical protein
VRDEDLEADFIAGFICPEFRQLISTTRPPWSGATDLDSDDTPLPRGDSGQIRLRTAGAATGYLNSSEDTAKRFRRLVLSWRHRLPAAGRAAGDPGPERRHDRAQSS